MSVTTVATHQKELPTCEILPARAVSSEQIRTQAPVVEGPDMSPFALKMVALTLFMGVLLLATLAAWVWYAAYQYQNIG